MECEKWIRNSSKARKAAKSEGQVQQILWHELDYHGSEVGDGSLRNLGIICIFGIQYYIHIHRYTVPLLDVIAYDFIDANQIWEHQVELF